MQGEDSHPHQPLVVRGDDGLGAIGAMHHVSWSGKLRPRSCSGASDVAHRANRNGVER
jgi:hypothetical protein